MLQIMGYFILSSLKRRNLVRQLQDMSCLDQLTKFGNRFALDKFIAGMKPEECVGIVYCDITGLKRVNDTEGHKAGDQLILRACESLNDEEGLFRVGGDELLAFCPRIGEEELEEKVERLKDKMAEYSVTMAVGAVWQKDFSAGIDSLLMESEKRMYEDKAEFYQKEGVDRRK